MKSKLRVGLGDQLCLDPPEHAEPAIDGRCRHTAFGSGKREVVLEVARLGGQQPAVKAPEPVRQVRCEHCKALAGTGIDQGHDA